MIFFGWLALLNLLPPQSLTSSLPPKKLPFSRKGLSSFPTFFRGKLAVKLPGVKTKKVSWQQLLRQTISLKTPLTRTTKDYSPGGRSFWEGNDSNHTFGTWYLLPFFFSQLHPGPNLVLQQKIFLENWLFQLLWWNQIIAYKMVVSPFNHPFQTGWRLSGTATTFSRCHLFAQASGFFQMLARNFPTQQKALARIFFCKTNIANGKCHHL